MRIVVSEFISLDGVVQAPGGPDEDRDGGFEHGGWSMPFFDPEVMGSAVDEIAKRTDALLYGRRTWQVMAGAWPGRAGDPFADWINAVEKHVVSSTLSEADLTWAPTSLIQGADLLAGVTALRERPGRDVNVMGSSQLVRSLLEEDLVDELNLMIEPIVLGGGKGIFPPDGTARRFELVSTTAAATGVQICRYQRARQVPMSEVAERYRRVAGRFTARANEVQEAAWEHPAPCDGWVARDVVRHLVEWMPAFLVAAGGPPLPVGPSVDDDPAGAWVTLDAGIQTLLDDPVASATEVSHPQAGTHRLDDAIATFFLGDVLVHTWDLARAAGLDETLDPEVVHDMLVGMEPLDEMLRASGHYGPRVEVPADADEQTRLIAFTGRQP